MGNHRPDFFGPGYPVPTHALPSGTRDWHNGRVKLFQGLRFPRGSAQPSLRRELIVGLSLLAAVAL